MVKKRVFIIIIIIIIFFFFNSNYFSHLFVYILFIKCKLNYYPKYFFFFYNCLALNSTHYTLNQINQIIIQLEYINQYPYIGLKTDFYVNG